MLSVRSAFIIMPEASKELIQGITETFIPRVNEWGPVAEKYIETLTGTEIEVKDYKKGSFAAAGALSEKMLGELLMTVMPPVDMTRPYKGYIAPAQGRESAEKYLGVNLSFNMQGWFLGLISDMFGLGAFKSFRNLPNQISWAFGFGWLSWLVMGTPFRIGIAEPMEVLYNRLYRPKRLLPSQIVKIYHSKPQMREICVDLLKDEGYNDDVIAILLDTERQKLSRTDLAIFWEYGLLAVEEMAQEIASDGYDPDQALVIATQIATKRKMEIIADIEKAAEKAFKAKSIDEPTLRSYMDAAGFDEGEIELTLAKLQLEMLEPPEAAPKEKGLTTGMVGGLYRDGKRTEDWTVLKLSEFNWRPEEIIDFLDYYKPKTPAERSGRELTAGMIGSLFKRELVTQDQAEEMWAQVGVRPDRIPYYVMYYKKPPYVPKEYRPATLFTPTRVGTLYKDGWVTLEEAKSILYELHDIPAEDAELFLVLYAPEVAAEPPAPGLGVYDISTAVAKGTISFEDGVARLVSRGWDADYATSYLRSERAYRVASDAASACILKEITFAEAVSRMVNVGWGRSDAEIYLKARGCTP